MNTVIYWFYFLLLMSAAQAQDYCSLIIRVIDADGRPNVGRVTVKERNGRTEIKESTGHDLKFCNLGITPVTISVGDPSCNQTIVRNAGVLWNEATRMTIMYDDKPCMIDSPPPISCQMLFRFNDKRDHWLSQATLRLQEPSAATAKADRFGRVWLTVPIGHKLVGQAIAEGYRPVGVDVACSREDYMLEQIITLERAYTGLHQRKGK